MVVKTKKVSKRVKVTFFAKPKKEIKLIKTRGIQILTKNNNIHSHYTEDGSFFQKRRNTKTFYWIPKNGKSGFGKNYEVKYGRVYSYLKNGVWIVLP